MNVDYVAYKAENVNKNNNIVEIKGKFYDATTGAPVKKQPESKTHKAAAGAKAARATDGRSPHHVTSHTPQPANTLMRHAVKRPDPALKRHTKAVGAHSAHAALQMPPSSTIIKPSAQRLDTHRLEYAHKVPKSPLISRFGTVQPASPSLWQVAAPQPAGATGPAAHIIKPHTNHPQTTAELLQYALEHTTSHEQPPVKQRRSSRLAKRIAARRVTSVSAMVVAAGLLFGFAFYANYSSIRLHAASSKAGFAASLPTYQPAGYRLAHLNSRPGTVAIEFQSNSDARSYAITEQVSAWDDQTLRSDFLAGLGQDYQSLSSAGHSFYVYGQNDATWVNKGVWYQIKSQGSLSMHQLVELASSL